MPANRSVWVAVTRRFSAMPLFIVRRWSEVANWAASVSSFVARARVGHIPQRLSVRIDPVPGQAPADLLQPKRDFLCPPRVAGDDIHLAQFQADGRQTVAAKGSDTQKQGDQHAKAKNIRVRRR
jgi:hypothetical protein